MFAKKSSVVAKKHLDYILSSASFNAPLRDRIEWLSDLLAWIRKGADVAVMKGGANGEVGKIQATRLRFIFQVLSRNPEWRLAMAKTIRSIVRDTDSIELFSHLGLPTEIGLFSEIVDRLILRSLPLPPGEDDLGEVFPMLFPDRQDAEWLERLDADIMQQIFDLCTYEVGDDEAGWNSFHRDMEEALMVLVGQVETTGLSFSIRKRLSSRRIYNIPFYQLSRITHQVVQTFGIDDVDVIKEQIDQYRTLLERCREEVRFALGQLSDFGVSLNVVYQLDRLESQIARITTLVDILVSEQVDKVRVAGFVATLVRESYERHHVMPLLSENLSLLSRRIADRHAKTGESYFTRTVPGYFRMLKKAGGGGVITGVTILAKELIYLLSVSNFWHGFLLACNYSASFVAIQLAHCTLATKQPAMTAPALAAKMHTLYDESAFGALVKEIIHLIRSQSAAVLGNVLLVVPSILIIYAVFLFVSGEPIIDEARARQVITDHNVFGLTLVFAAVTGSFLWISSVMAGLVDNWLAYRQVPTALAASRRMRQVFGEEGARRLGVLLSKYGTGLAGNISLGFLLGIVPQIIMFFGIYFDVRHVTLASGSLALAAVTLGAEVFREPGFWLATVGIFLTGVLNVTVSFGLALAVAMKARRVETVARHRLYRSLWRRILRNPLAIIFPVGLAGQDNPKSPAP